MLWCGEYRVLPATGQIRSTAAEPSRNATKPLKNGPAKRTKKEHQRLPILAAIAAVSFGFGSYEWVRSRCYIISAF